ncbi:MAG: methylmalonyl Co-A mutase-associated GTPase MeaB [Acidimicrobiia bacterium]|nr:methylmalonyl Co-A mutase-associated GTPase MeaB [Actinomycetota bacterium]MBL6923961.1 methylmalonyl Co-A mutase-associated GTPase MeaB [Acidimicrobiia bacterium]MBL6926522.1 methylmalonyl Co-A mutase-associated GTPase MeaB [Acidimicrobiia bacterium]
MGPTETGSGSSAVAELAEASRSGDRRATARLLSLVERGGPQADEVASATHFHVGGAHVVGVTGAPGSGKSTITNSLTTLLAEAGRRPAVLAVDPSSPLTGGAILGDRVRMNGAAEAGVFIRSMATRGHAGGLALAVPGAVRVLDAAGFDPVIIETVGVGQVEVDVTDAADTTVVVVAPGWGDAVQANKAGLLEVADLFVVNKADRPGADDARRDLDLMLDLSTITGRVGGERPSVTMTTATEGDGIAELAEAVVGHLGRLSDGEELAQRRERRRLAEVRAHLGHLLEGAGEEVLATEASKATNPAESPMMVARRLAAGLLG